MGGSSTEVGRHWRIAYAHALSLGPLDAFLGWHVAEQEAWAGRITESTALNVNRPQLLGGEEDQGGVVGLLNVQFGTADQLPNNYGLSVHGPALAAYRGVAVAHWEGGRYGANNPYAPDAEYRVERIVAGWEPEPCWYPAKAPVPIGGEFAPGTPGAGTYRWAARHTASAYVAASPDGIDWAAEVAFSPVASAEINFGESVVAVAKNGDTFYAPWADPGAWVPGPNTGTEVYFTHKTAVIDDRLWVFGSGYAFTDDPAEEYVTGSGRAYLIAGNATYVVRYAGMPAMGHSDGYAFYRSANRGDSFAHISTLTIGGEGEHNYAYYLEAADASESRIAFGGADRHNNSVVFYSDDGFETIHQSTMPVGQTGSIREIRHIGGDEWLALVYEGMAASGPSFLLRSTDNLATLATFTLPISGTAKVANLFQGNAGVDKGSGQVLLVYMSDDGPVLLETQDRVTWTVVPTTFGVDSIYRIAPTDTGTPPAQIGRYAMNPAHMILESHCDPDGAEYERDSVDLDHLQVQADWYYENTFGLCWVWDSSKESASQYIERIEEVAACSWARNHADGKWRLTVANGVYDFGSLPIITDDDILSFSKAKLDLSEAINSVSVKYFDPALKEEIITIPVRADDLIKAYGLRHKTYDFLSIPIDHIAARVAQRMLDNHTKERWVFNMDTNRKANGFVKNTYFQLQVPKRGISDMVCIAMEVDHAALKSGGIRLMAHEEIYSLPLTVYTGVQPGGTSGPDKVPKPIVHQRAIEAPYIDLASSMAADALAALPADAGFAVGMAADPGRSRDFSMLVAPDGGAYVEVSKGAFCPTAVTVAQVNPMDTYVLLDEAQELAGVSVGDLVLIGDELRAVEAVDVGAVAVTLSLACADTVPALHPAGTRLFFYANRAAYDPTEHTEGEALDIKLLTNSSGKQLPEASAVAMDLTMARRKDRPYPPGNLMINGLPFYGTGNTAPPTSGGGGGGGGPPHPPATTPTGAPASTTLGPNGGYADNAPHPVPQPTVYSTDLIPDGTLSGWTDPAGRPLGGQWSIEAGGMVYQGSAPSSAVYEPAKLRMSQYPLPRWQITVSAEIQTEIGQRAALGVAWGTSNASALPYSDASTPQEYPVPTTVTHTYTPAVTRAGLAYPNVDVIQLIMPLLVADARGPSRTRFRNVSMTVEQVPTPVTVASIANLGFASGLTGWTQWPAPNAVTPTLTVAPGGVKATGVSADGAFTFLINDDPITQADVVGKALRMRGEFWSNDPTVITPPGVPRNGASLQIAVKPPGGEYIVLPWQSSSMYRGDWTPREIWQIAEVATAAGYSVHLAIRMQQAVGYSSGVRNISVAVTDDPVA